MPKRRQLGLEEVDRLLETRHLLVANRRFLDARADLFTRIRQLRADGKQIALYLDDHVIEIVVERRSAHDAKPRVELVDFAVGSDAGIGLADANTAIQRRVAAV